ncbi:MAG: Gfo/Idh/MocA family oxidoreductase [Armatimonadetes bacterium]|nr:Gfo/Idh/MocA family oxidoreductase [Armatimonadota bacterium]
MTSQHPLRVGIAGCGYQGNELARAVARIDELRLVACADPDLAAASRAAAMAPDASTHPSVEALLGESEVDAILIATPHHVLAPAALAAVRAGKHVMAEKPIALNAREAAEIEAAVAEAGVCYMAGYSFRYSMAKHVHDLIAAGAAGEIQAITGAIGFAPLAKEGWTAFPESGGGPLLYVGSHLVDMFLWFLGDDAVEVYADVRRRADTGADDTSAFQVRFARGAVAQGLVTQAAASFFYTLDIQGRDGRVFLRGANFLQYEIEVASRALTAYAQPCVIRPLVGPDNVTTMLVPELKAFAQAIREGQPAPITAHDGRRVLQVLDAVVQSGRERCPVLIRDERASALVG